METDIVSMDDLMNDIPAIVENTPAIVTDAVSMDDLMNDRSVILQRESTMTANLTDKLINVGAASLKPKLLEWASLNFPAIFVLISVPVDLPDVCSDGVSRSIHPFLEFCLGMKLSDVVASISKKLPGMEVSYSYTNSYVFIHVSKV
jgi:hypothetical protein